MRLWLGRASMAAVAAAAPAAGPQLSSASSHAGSPGALWQQRRHRPSELQRRCLVVEVNARDGKQRRKPQPRDGDGSSSGSDEDMQQRSQPARRVDQHNGMPVKLQIDLSKKWKKYEREQSAGYRKPPVPQAYRKDTLDTVEFKQARAAAEAAAAEAARQKSELVTLQQMFGSAAADRQSLTAQPLGVTLVDGHNFLNKWAADSARVADLMCGDGVEGGLEGAREYLMRQLDVYGIAQGMFVHVVYDAMTQGQDSQASQWGMLVSFASKDEADTVIKELAQEYANKGVSKVCIVTDDSELANLRLAAIVRPDPKRQMVCAASCASLIKLIAASHKQVEGQLEAPAQRLRHEKAGKRARIVKRGTVLGQGLAGLRGAMVEQEAAAQQAQRQRRRGDGGGGGDGGDQCSDGTAAAG
ncbi:PIN domain containing [Micractinium conductrix]|uniref:PIN domain containing n=1 Tax=Micractinium conductrix TaxID=554055 RepID=A0A2P6VN36_9CHLO|nr:PIN domain containing [Micractinium conductrix]|eukprot:PSC75493.1 PIN domain containing [Micractinium conductrix]